MRFTNRSVVKFVSLSIAALLMVSACDRFSGSREVPTAPEPAAKGAGPQFVSYDEPPRPVGGFAAIQSNLRYPEEAKNAGIEGRVILNCFIQTDGSVDSVTVLKSSGREDLDQAAVEAVRKSTWEPAKANGRPVAVWVGIPVIFSLSRPQENVASYTGPFKMPSPVLEKSRLDDITSRVQREKGELEGTVTIKLIISEIGEVVDAQVDASTRAHPLLQKAALKLARDYRWKPAYAGSRAVTSQVLWTVSFDRQGWRWHLKAAPLK